MPLKVLVTGGKGFVGKHLVKALRDAGHYVGIMDVDCDEIVAWDGIIHLAAVSRVSDAERDPVGCLQTNVVLTAEVMKRPCKWFILASTNEPPDSVYGLSKRFAEDYARYMAGKLGIGLRMLRFATVYGDGDNPDKLIPSVARKIAANEEPVIRPEALPVQFIGVHDLVMEVIEAMDYVAANPIVYPHAMPLCYGVAKTADELKILAESTLRSHVCG